MGSLAGIIGFFLASLSSKLWMMYLTYGVLSGFGYTMIYNSSFLIVLQYFVKWRSMAIGIVASAPALSLFVMTQITQSLLTRFGWHGAILGFSLLHVVCTLCSVTFVPLENLKKKRKNDITVKKIYQLKATTENTSLWRNPSFLIMLSSFTLVTFAFWVPAIHIVSNCNYVVCFNLVDTVVTMVTAKVSIILRTKRYDSHVLRLRSGQIMNF